MMDNPNLGRERLGRPWAAILALCVTSVGCAGKVAGDDGSAARARDLQAWDAAVTNAVCAKQVQCSDQIGIGEYSSTEACVDDKNPEAYDLFWFGIHHYEALALTYRVADAETQSGCLAAIAAAPCGAATPDICARVYVPILPPLEVGEPCKDYTFESTLESVALYSGDQGTRFCDTGLVCDRDQACPVCAKPAAAVGENQPCSATVPCQAGLECCAPGSYCLSSDATVSSCQVPPSSTSAPSPEGLPTGGQPCVDGTTCASAFYCELLGLMPTPSGICKPKGGVGSPCTDPSIEAGCAADLYCDDTSGKCQPYALEGETCSRDSGNGACVHGLWCLYDAPDSKTGTCGLPSAGKAGQPLPCSRFGDQGDELACPVPLRPDDHGTDPSQQLGVSVDYCECLPFLENGAACSSLYQCQSRHCASGICTAGLPDGTACTSDDDCTSFTCDTTSGKCVASPPPSPSCPAP